MVAIFAPAFLLPLAAIALGLRRYWAEVGGTRVRWPHLRAAVDAAQLRNLSGGQGGCNFEKGDRYSNARRHAHQAVLWGFLLCFAATSAAPFCTTSSTGGALRDLQPAEAAGRAGRHPADVLGTAG
jgi:citrate/tricarballylate utilization protein